MGPGGTSFEGVASLATGSNTVTIAATDENANTTTEQYQVTVASGATRTLTYDDNGNCLDDGERTYEWDAKNRLLAIQKAGEWRTEFTYDGLDRRVKMKDIDISGTPTTTREVALLWDGLSIEEERDATGATVQKHYFGQGVEIVSGATMGEYLYLRDHLGSVWELTDNDSSATIRARYKFGPWGQRSGNLVSISPVAIDFAFTGHLYHERSEHCLAPFRSYNPNIARWMSGDWLGEYDGPNVYAYVSNDPVNYTDPSGLLRFRRHGRWGGQDWLMDNLRYIPNLTINGPKKASPAGEGRLMIVTGATMSMIETYAIVRKRGTQDFVSGVEGW